MRLVADFDTSAFRVFDGLDAGSDKVRSEMSRAANRIGNRMIPVVRAAVTAQTGLPRATIGRALRIYHATPDKPAFAIWTAGGDISLKYFGAKETRKGVSAAPRGKRTTYAGLFTKAGKFPNRVTPRRLNGHVYANVDGGKWGGKITKQDSDVVIPEDLVSGASAAAFNRIAASEMPNAARDLLRKLVPAAR